MGPPPNRDQPWTNRIVFRAEMFSQSCKKHVFFIRVKASFLLMFRSYFFYSPPVESESLENTLLLGQNFVAFTYFSFHLV